MLLPRGKKRASHQVVDAISRRCRTMKQFCLIYMFQNETPPVFATVPTTNSSRRSRKCVGNGILSCCFNLGEWC
jgi:hypothetical protein